MDCSKTFKNSGSVFLPLVLPKKKNVHVSIPQKYIANNRKQQKWVEREVKFSTCSADKSFQELAIMLWVPQNLSLFDSLGGVEQLAAALKSSARELN